MLRIIYIVAAVVAMSAVAFAQESAAEEHDQEVVLWTVEGADAKTVQVFRSSVVQALAGEAGQHLLTDAALRKYVEDNTGPLPGCILGVESCPGPRALAFSALGLSSAIHVVLTTSSGQVLANYELIDGRGTVTRESSVSGASARDTAFAVVRDIFDATGSAKFETTPSGAAIFIDGKQVGVTPNLVRLPVGKHSFSMVFADRAPFEGHVELRKGTTEAVSHTFEELPGVLMVTDAPKGAKIFINDEERGVVGQPIELSPGTYAIEVRAKGYEPMRDAATIAAGEEVRKSAPLSQTSGLLGELRQESIALNNYVFRLGYEHGIQTATYQDARTDDDAPHELRSFTDQNGGFPAVGALDRTVHTNGFRLDFAYQFQNIGIVLFSMSYLLGEPNEPVAVTTPSGGDEPGTLVGIQRLQLRPFQVSYREFYKNFVPFVEGGMGMDFTWLDVESERFAPVTLSQSEGFLGLSAGLQYYVTPNFFAIARYSLQAYFDNGSGSDHLLYIGVGAGFPNIFGFDAEPPEKL